MGWDGDGFFMLGWRFFLLLMSGSTDDALFVSFRFVCVDGAWTRGWCPWTRQGDKVAWDCFSLSLSRKPATDFFSQFHTLSKCSFTRADEIEVAVYTFKRKVRIAIFSCLFCESHKLKFLIFSRYFLVEDWPAVSTVRSREVVAIFYFFRNFKKL